jgi:hypothetical protein
VKFLQNRAIATIGSKNCGLKHRQIKPSGVYPPGGSLGLFSPWSSSKIVGFEARELVHHGRDARGIWPWNAKAGGLGKPLRFFAETPSKGAEGLKSS